jgi:hypothetical protein
MKPSLKLVVLLLCFLSASCAANNKHMAAKDNLRIEAYLAAAGTYVQIWKISLKEYDDGSGATIRFKASLGMGKGRIQGDDLIHRARLSVIKDLLTKTNFNQLPPTISAEMVALHRPDYRITACAGTRCHTVNLYDPSDVGSSPEGQRFLEVWNAIVEPLPLKPEWK